MGPDTPGYDLYPPQQPKSSLTSSFVEFAETIVVFFAIFFIVYLFVAQPHKVSGPSMYPTFKDGDYIISEKISYYMGKPQRGDVIVFKDPKDHSLDFIKRVIGIPGDKVEIIDDKVYVNGSQVNESYLTSDVITAGRQFIPEGQEIAVPENEYIVFGDNREHSSDSREWGYVKRDEIIGKVFLRYWPPNSLGFFPGAVKK